MRYELGEYDVTVRVLEDLVKPKTKKQARGEPTDAAADVESKWVDLLIKSYVKVGRVGDAVVLTDEQLARIDPVKEPVVHARVALTVFPWRYGAAVWKGVSSHYQQLVRASGAPKSPIPPIKESPILPLQKEMYSYWRARLRVIAAAVGQGGGAGLITDDAPQLAHLPRQRAGYASRLPLRLRDVPEPAHQRHLPAASSVPELPGDRAMFTLPTANPLYSSGRDCQVPVHLHFFLSLDLVLWLIY